MSLQLKIIATGLFFIISLVSGYLMSRGGRPFGALIFNIHKFAALGLLVFAAMVLHNLSGNPGIHTLSAILLVATGASCIILFLSGALLSIGKFPDTAMVIHRAGTIALVVMAAVDVSLFIFVRH